MVLYYPEVGGGSCLNNYSFLMMMYTSFVITKSERKVTWRFIGTDVPCWTPEDVKSICPDDKTVRYSMFTSLIYNVLIDNLVV